MAGILSSALHKAANPRKRPEVSLGRFENLSDKTALILFAVAEAVLGENFLKKAPRFLEMVDDHLNYQRPAQREQFFLALIITEIRLLTLLADAPPKPFSHLSLADRSKVLEKLRASKSGQSRNIYAAFVNVSASTYYASDLTWPGLGYPGVSVEHPELLDRKPPIPWRPGDPRPIEP